jgi:hypothetical protein
LDFFLVWKKSKTKAIPQQSSFDRACYLRNESYDVKASNTNGTDEHHEDRYK